MFVKDLMSFREMKQMLVAHRKDCGLTQEVVAEKMNTTASSISRFETYEHVPNIVSIIKYCNAIDYVLDVELIDG